MADKIEELKKVMIEMLGFFHDTITDVATEESNEWRKEFLYEVNQIEKTIMEI